MRMQTMGIFMVVLAACRAAEGTYDVVRRWSLPDAFLATGARAVIAADVAVPDEDVLTGATVAGGAPRLLVARHAQVIGLADAAAKKNGIDV